MTEASSKAASPMDAANADSPQESRLPRKPSMKPWLPLRCEDGMAITVPDDCTDRLGALIELLHAEYGGPFTRDNPVLIRAADECRIQVWRSFTKADIEGECVDWDEGDGTYYGVQGSGARHVTVLWCERGPYVLGEQAEAAEATPEVVGITGERPA